MWSCATTECPYPVGADDHIGPSRSASHPVVAADHSGQSRSAIAGISDYQNGRRLYRPSKTVGISPRVRSGACATRSQSPRESCATTGRYVFHRRGEHRSPASSVRRHLPQANPNAPAPPPNISPQSSGRATKSCGAPGLSRANPARAPDPKIFSKKNTIYHTCNQSLTVP